MNTFTRIMSEIAVNPPKQESKCPGPSRCVSCPAFAAKECDGCSIEYRDETCTKASCELQCKGCGGIGGINDNTMAACGRNESLRDTWYREVGGFSFDWESAVAQEQLIFKQRFIPVLNAQESSRIIPAKRPDITTWAINAGRVFSKSGQPASEDFKDFLSLRSSDTLVLTMNAPEDWMEMLWRRDDAGFAQYHVDYWFPTYFSVMPDDCKFMQHFNVKRGLVSMARSNSQFFFPMISGVKSPSWYKGMSGKARNVLHTEVYIHRTALGILPYRKHLDGILEVLAPPLSLFFDNMTSPAYLASVLGEKLWTRVSLMPYHALGKAWFMSAVRGGKVIDPDFDKNVVVSRDEAAILNLDYCLRAWGENA